MSPTINGTGGSGPVGGGVTSSTAGNSPVSTGTSLSSSRQSPPGNGSYIKPILSGTPPIQPPPSVYHPSSGKFTKPIFEIFFFVFFAKVF